MGRSTRVCWLWLLLCTCFVAAVGLYAWRFFTRIRPTPFAAEITATSLSFTSPGDPAVRKDANEQAAGAQPLSLFAGSPRMVNLGIEGCDSVESVTSGREEKCEALGLQAGGVLLSHVELPADTRVWLHVAGGALWLQLERDGKDAAVVSFTRPSGRLDAGEWRMHPADKVLTIVLKDVDGAQFVPGREEDHPVAEGSALRLDPDADAPEGANTLHLPDLPKELSSMAVGESPVRVNQLTHGELRHLALVRNKAGEMEALRVTVTGTSPSMMVYDRYENAPRNQALTSFDANSGKDRKLRMIVIFLLLAGALGFLSTLLGVALHSLELMEMLHAWRGHHPPGQRAKRPEGEEQELEAQEDEPGAVVEAPEAGVAEPAATAEVGHE